MGDSRWNRIVFYALNGESSRSKGIRIDHKSYSDLMEKLHGRIILPPGQSISVCQGGLKEVNAHSYEAIENGSIIRVISDEPLEMRDYGPETSKNIGSGNQNGSSYTPYKKERSQDEVSETGSLNSFKSDSPNGALSSTASDFSTSDLIPGLDLIAVGPPCTGPSVQFINCKQFGPLLYSATAELAQLDIASFATIIESTNALLKHTGTNYYQPVLNLFRELNLKPRLWLNTSGFDYNIAEAKIHHTRAYRMHLEGWAENENWDLFLQSSPDLSKLLIFIERAGLVEIAIQNERTRLLAEGRLPLVMDIDGTIIKNPGTLESEIEFRPHFLEVVQQLEPFYEMLLFSCGIPKHISRVATKINTELGKELIPSSRLISTTEVNWEKRRKEKRLEFVYTFCIAGDPTTWDLPLIVDDKPGAWEKKQRSNVIEVKEYFGGQEEDNTWLEMKKILTQVHSDFFSQHNETSIHSDTRSAVDVRKILAPLKNLMASQEKV